MEGASVLKPAEGPEKEAPKRLGVAGIAAMLVCVVDGMNFGSLYRLWGETWLSSGYLICVGGVCVFDVVVAKRDGVVVACE